MNIVQVMREVARELRRVRMLSIDGDLDELAQQLDDAIAEPDGAVDLAFCCGSECIKLHGIRVATWRGLGPCSIYIVCDECHAERLTADERKHMVELFGAAWVRHLGLHALSHDRAEPPRASALDRLAAQDWGHLGEPGERVLLLAAQGFDGVGRGDAAKRAQQMANKCRDDAEAIELLKSHFQWNERADLPFPIRELFGFDRDGNWSEVYTQP